MNKDICERYDATSLQQLTKIITDENGEHKDKDVYPISVIQAIFDGITGTRLDHILSFCNCIYVPFQGTREATRLMIGSQMRRKGLIIVFRDLDNMTYTQRYIYGESVSDEHWGYDDNWEDCFVSFDDLESVEQLKQYLTEYIDEKFKDLIDNIKTLKFQIVESLPKTGENSIIYLVPTENNDEGTNKYTEWVWLEDEQRYEPLGSFVDIVVDDTLSETSENPVQNKVITEALNRINKELFPLKLTVTGGGLFEKRTEQTINVEFHLYEGNEEVSAESANINGEIVTGSNGKSYDGVSTNTTYTVTVVKDGQTLKGSTSATFVNPSYFGVVAAGFTPTEEVIKALTKSVKNSKNYTGTATLNNQKTCYAYPKSFGALTAIKDANNFEYLSSYTRTELTVWDETYYVYVLTDPTTIDGFKQIYS